MKMLVALDPGKTVGVAICAYDLKKRTARWDHAQVRDNEVWSILELYSEKGLQRVIAESFTFRAKTAVNLVGAEVQGIIKEFCRQFRIPYEPQNPSEGKHYFTNKRLIDLDLYIPNKPHANDATRHLLYYLNFGGGKGLVPYAKGVGVVKRRS